MKSGDTETSERNGQRPWRDKKLTEESRNGLLAKIARATELTGKSGEPELLAKLR